MKFQVTTNKPESVVVLSLANCADGSVDVEGITENGEEWLLLNISALGVKRYTGIDIPDLTVDENDVIKILEEYA